MDWVVTRLKLRKVQTAKNYYCFVRLFRENPTGSSEIERARGLYRFAASVVFAALGSTRC